MSNHRILLLFLFGNKSKNWSLIIIGHLLRLHKQFPQLLFSFMFQKFSPALSKLLYHCNSYINIFLNLERWTIVWHWMIFLFFTICRIRVPYPFQWGRPDFNAGDAFSMMAAAFVAIVEVNAYEVHSCFLYWISYSNFDTSWLQLCIQMFILHSIHKVDQSSLLRCLRKLLLVCLHIWFSWRCNKE